MVTNFTLKEILTPEQYEFAIMMQELRDWYGKPINVSSWTRTIKHNKKVGGSSNSIHLDGRAVDIKIKPYNSFTEQWKKICQAHKKVGGINLYNTYMHLDNYEDKFGYKKFVIRDYRK